MPQTVEQGLRKTIFGLKADNALLQERVARLESEKAVLKIERDEALALVAIRDAELLKARNELAEFRVQHAAQRETLRDLLEKLATVDERVKRLLRRAFAAASERARADQTIMHEMLAFFADPIETTIPENPASAVTMPPSTPSETMTEANANGTKKKHSRPANAGGRNPLPADLPRHDVQYTPPADHPLLKNALTTERIGDRVIERLTVSPTRVSVERITCPVMACTYAGGVSLQQTIAPPAVIARGQVDDAFLVQSAVDKVADHLPAHRQQVRAQREGLELHRSKIARWHIQLGTFLESVSDAILAEILQEKVVGIDDTTHRLLVPDKPTCQKGKLWAITSEMSVFYHFTPTREGRWLEDLLHAYSGGVMGDAYAGHNQILNREDIEPYFCWAHVRRKFIECPTSPKRTQILDLIGKLYHIESQLTTDTIQQRAFQRSAKAKPIIQTIKTLLLSLQNDPSILPKSSLGIAINYTNKLWPGLERYAAAGFAPIDNNRTERAMRPVALLRKNSLFSASTDGAHAYAILLTLTNTAILHDLNPEQYLNDIIADLHFQRQKPAMLTPAAYVLRLGTVSKQSS